MFKTTLLLALPLLGFLVAPVMVKQAPAPTPVHIVKPAAVLEPGSSEAPMRVITLSEVVISAPKAKAARAVKREESKPTIRCHVRDLTQGVGQVRVCDSV